MWKNKSFKLYETFVSFVKPIVDYIDEQFEAYLQEELKIKRNLSTYHDSRYDLSFDCLRWFNKSI